MTAEYHAQIQEREAEDAMQRDMARDVEEEAREGERPNPFDIDAAYGPDGDWVDVSREYAGGGQAFGMDLGMDAGASPVPEKPKRAPARHYVGDMELSGGDEGASRSVSL